MKAMQTRIKTVTVFRDGARVVRTGKIELGKGEQTVQLSGITVYAEEDSVRVKGQGKATFRSIDVKKVTETYEPESDIKQDLLKLKDLEREKKTIQDQLELQQSRVSHLTSIMTQFSAEFGKWFSAGETSMDHLTKMDKANSDLVTDARKKLRDLSKEQERVNTEIAALKANIQRVQGERRTQTFTEIFVTLEAKESTTLELEVTYQLSAASWYPTYDVDIGTGKTSLKRIAMVYNNTLEDWQDISLIVSTASAKPIEAIKPQPYYVDIFHPAPIGVSYDFADRSHAAMPKMKKEGIVKEENMGDLVSEEPMPEIVEEYAEATEGLQGITIYEVPGEVTIASERDPHPVTLSLDEFESKRLHFWNAYAMPEVVAQEELVNGDLVILPGNVKVYADGDFIGETNLGTVAPREKFRLGTRAAYDVKAEKKLLEKDTEKAGITRGKQKRGYVYSLELKNFSKRDIEIRIIDRIPYSSSEKLVVQVSQPTVSYEKMELGVITWEAKIEAGKEMKIQYGFEVEWEKDLVIRPPLP